MNDQFKEILRRRAERFEGADFYQSPEWLEVRYRVLKRFGGCCMCCGVRPGLDKNVHVDHIKPRSKYPELELDPNNLQVLCHDCNIGKGAWDETDWRWK